MAKTFDIKEGQEDKSFVFLIYYERNDVLQGIFTTTCHMATLIYWIVQKGGQVTKSIVVVIIPCKIPFLSQ